MLSYAKKNIGIVAIVSIILLLIAGVIIYQVTINTEPQSELINGFELLHDDFHKLSDRDIETYVSMAIGDELEKVISMMEEVESTWILIELPDEKWPTEKKVLLSIQLVEGKELDIVKLKKITQLVLAATNVTKERIEIINRSTGEIYEIL